MEINGYVYLLCDPSNDLFKIGVTRSPKGKRFKQLQTGNGTELILRYLYPCEYPFELEKILHRKFSYKRELGEWFLLDVDDVIGFMDICKKEDELMHTVFEIQDKLKSGKPYYI